MKTKLTVTIDESILPEAKRYAKRQGTSLSNLIEQGLRDATASGKPTFSARWRGRFEPARGTDNRYRLLAKKYL